MSAPSAHDDGRDMSAGPIGIGRHKQPSGEVGHAAASAPCSTRDARATGRRLARVAAAAVLFSTVLAVAPRPASAHTVKGYLDTSHSSNTKTIGEGGKGWYRVCRTSATHHVPGHQRGWSSSIWDWKVTTFGTGSDKFANLADISPNSRSGYAYLDWDEDQSTLCTWFSVQTADDNIVEPTETFSVEVIKFQHKHHAPDGLGTPNSMAVQITDNDGVLSVEDVTADEGDDLVFTISMDNSVVPGGHTVTPTIRNLTTETGLLADYSVTLDPITFTGGANESHTLTVSTTEDSRVEYDETFELTVTSSNTNMKTGKAKATGTITDDDSATLTIQNVTANEGTRAVYSVSQNDVYVEDPFTVNVVQAADTSTGAKPARSHQAANSWEEADFIAETGELRFDGSAKGSRSASVYLMVNKDEDTTDTPPVERDDETFVLDGTVSDAGGRSISVSDGKVTIKNSSATRIVLGSEGGPYNEGTNENYDRYIVIPISKGPLVWDEDKGNVTVKVKILADGTTMDSDDYETSGGSPVFTCWDKHPTADSTFDATTDRNVLATGIAGQSPDSGHHCALDPSTLEETVYVRLKYEDDAVREPDETITFGFEAATYHGLTGSQYQVDASATATFTLKNDDKERVYFEVVESSATGEDKHVISENGGYVEVRAVTADRWDPTKPVPAAGDTHVTMSVSGGEAALSDTELFIPKGQTQSTGTITVSAVDNPWDDGTIGVGTPLECRCRRLTLGMFTSSPVGVYSSGGIGVTVNEDDESGITATPDTSIQLPGVVHPAALVREGAAAVRYSVVLRTEPKSNVTVTPAPIASADSDVVVSNATGDTGANATLTFTPQTWQHPRPLFVSVGQDADAISGEAGINLTATSSDPAYNGGGVRKRGYMLAIEIDDDAGVTMTGPASNWANSLALTEDTASSYTLVLAADPGDVPVTIRVALDPDDSNDDVSLTLDAAKCDASGDDAKVTSKDFSFTGGNSGNWDTAQTVNVHACADSGIGSGNVTLTHTVVEADGDGNGIVDRNQTYLALTPEGGPSQIPDVAVSVLDDDATVVSLVLRDGPAATDSKVTSVTEGDDVAHVSATLAAAVSSAVTVRVSVSPAPDTLASRYSVSGSTLTIPAGQTTSTNTVRITPRDDEMDRRDGAVVVSATSTSSAAVTGPLSAVLTLAEDDEAAVVSAGSGLDPVAEGASGTYTVKLATEPADEVIVTPVVPEANASDVVVSPESITFTASDYETAQTFTVRSLMDDDIADVDEFEISHDVETTSEDTDDGYGSLSGDDLGPVEVSVTDVSAAVAISAQSLSVDEAATGSFPAYSVVLAAAPASGETVTVTASWATTPTRDTDLRFVASGACPADSGAATKTLTFTSSNWYQAQDVAVCAADDADTAAGTAKIAHAVSSSVDNAKYDDVTAEAVTLTEAENDVAAIRLASASQQQTLSGFGEIHVVESTASTTGYQTVSAALAKAPTADVTVKVALAGDGFSLADSSGNAPSNDDPDDHTLSLTFTSDNYSTAQSFRVVSAADDDAAVNTATVTLAASSDDDDYEGVSTTFAAVQVDDDSAGLEVSARSLGVREGSYGHYSLRLRSKPFADVRVYIQRLEGDTSLYSSTGVATFTPADWDQWRKIYVRASGDSDRDNGTATLGHLVTSSDDHYHGIPTGYADISVTEGDSGLAQILLSKETLSVPEGGSAVYSASLTRAPSSSVTVLVHSQTTGDTDLTADTDPDVAGDQVSLTFGPSTWSAPQDIAISAAADNDSTAGARLFAHTASSTDQNYATAGHTLITATEAEPVTPRNVLISPSSLRLSDTRSNYLTVWLASAPAANKPVTVYLAPLGNATVSVHPQRLTFTSDNWSQPQVVSLRLASDNGGGGAGGASAQSGVAGAQAGAAAAGATAANTATQPTVVQLNVNVSSDDSNYDGVDVSPVPLSSGAQPINEPDVQPGADPTGATGGSGTGGGAQRTARTARVGGSDRYDTAARLGATYLGRLAEGQGTAGGRADRTGPAVTVDTVIVVSGDDFPDALAASVLSRALHAPILLTSSDGLDADVSSFIAANGITRAHIVGGAAAVSSETEATLRAVPGITDVQRHAGADRYETAVAAAEAAAAASAAGGSARVAAGALCSTQTSTAILASGTSFADAMIAGPLAYRGRHPVLLTERDALPEATLSWLTANGVAQVVIVGGEAAVGASVRAALAAAGIGTVPISGANRYDTAARLAKHLMSLTQAARAASAWTGSCFHDSVIGLASGLGFPDALAAAPLLGNMGAPLLLTGADLPAETLAYVADGHLAANPAGEPIIAIGGYSAVSATHLKALAAALAP